MRRISNIILYCILALLALWQLPWCYNFLFAPKGESMPFTLYSGEADDFIQVYSVDKVQMRRSVSGKEYTVEEADSLLPFMYMRQLVSNGRMPDSIQGVPVTPQRIQQTNVNYRIACKDVNRPELSIYGLMESMPKRVDLELPDDAFRFTDQGIEFVDMNTNQRKDRKSQLFTDALAKKGFQFPASRLNGNCTNRKDYDEGYLVIDNAHKLFHLKMTSGRPYVKAIDLPEGVEAQFCFITEFRSRCARGFVTDQNNALYVLDPYYELVPLMATDGPIHYDPLANNLQLMGNLLDWTLHISNAEGEEFYALDARDWHLLNQYIVLAPDPYVFGLHFTEPSTDKWVYPRF